MVFTLFKTDLTAREVEIDINSHDHESLLKIMKPLVTRNNEEIEIYRGFSIDWQTCTLYMSEKTGYEPNELLNFMLTISMNRDNFNRRYFDAHGIVFGGDIVVECDNPIDIFDFNLLYDSD